MLAVRCYRNEFPSIPLRVCLSIRRTIDGRELTSKFIQTIFSIRFEMGKKKRGANKLARMSDEERARYLQHRADIEEENRRRKQQLIAIFMKVCFSAAIMGIHELNEGKM